MATIETESKPQPTVKPAGSMATGCGFVARFLRSPFAPALLTSLLLYLSFFPVNWGWLGWVALVPLLHLAVGPRRKYLYLATWLSGFAFALPALQWIRLASAPMYGAWIGLALFISLHFLLFVWLVRRLTLSARVPLLLAAPAVWTALEFIRANIGIGFPWYYLGHPQHDFLAVIQIADLFGAYGVSFLVVMVNVVLFQLWQSWRLTRYVGEASHRRALAGSAVVTGVLLVASLVYGFWRLGQKDFEAGPRVALLQGNLPQHIRNDPGENRRVSEHFDALAMQAAKAEPKPDLIVWSETSRPEPWLRIDPEMDLQAAPKAWQEAHQASTRIGIEIKEGFEIPTLLGLNSGILEPGGERQYNSALLIGADGQPLERYDKMYRVPFGEYVPWEETLPLMRWFTPYEGNYGINAGTKWAVFDLPGTRPYRFAVLICYEDTVPHLATRYVNCLREQPPHPDFFINISNDGWFKGSEEHEQHLVAARFRAVECRRAVTRAVNMGVSAVIDGNGRVVALPAETWSASKDRAAVLMAQVPIDRRVSYYAMWGDLPLGLVWAECGLWGLLVLVRHRFGSRVINPIPQTSG